MCLLCTELVIQSDMEKKWYSALHYGLDCNFIINIYILMSLISHETWLCDLHLMNHCIVYYDLKMENMKHMVFMF